MGRRPPRGARQFINFSLFNKSNFFDLIERERKDWWWLRPTSPLRAKPAFRSLIPSNSIPFPCSFHLIPFNSLINQFTNQSSISFQFHQNKLNFFSLLMEEWMKWRDWWGSKPAKQAKQINLFFSSTKKRELIVGRLLCGCCGPHCAQSHSFLSSNQMFHWFDWKEIEWIGSLTHLCFVGFHFIPSIRRKGQPKQSTPSTSFLFSFSKRKEKSWWVDCGCFHNLLPP